MLPSQYGYVRGWTRTWHLVEAPLSSVKPWLDPKVTKPAVCGRRLPADLGDWGLVCGAVGEGTKVCTRCVKKALRPTRETPERRLGR